MAYELDYLAELMRDFPVSADANPASAFSLIGARFELLEEFCEGFQKEFSTYSARAQSVALRTLCSTFHRFLFQDILSNAGVIRKSSDPRNGFVGFGSDRARRPSGMEFVGMAPDKIENELGRLFQIFGKSSRRPVIIAVEFYQRFVLIHPFYDANGRIGRLLVSLYLGSRGSLFAGKSWTNRKRMNS